MTGQLIKSPVCMYDPEDIKVEVGDGPGHEEVGVYGSPIQE